MLLTGNDAIDVSSNIQRFFFNPNNSNHQPIKTHCYQVVIVTLHLPSHLSYMHPCVHRVHSLSVDGRTERGVFHIHPMVTYSFVSSHPRSQCSGNIIWIVWWLLLRWVIVMAVWRRVAQSDECHRIVSVSINVSLLYDHNRYLSATVPSFIQTHKILGTNVVLHHLHHPYIPIAIYFFIFVFSSS